MNTSLSDFELKEGLVRFRGRFWIGNDMETQLQLVKYLHNSAVGGHSRFHATYHRVKRLFAWTCMKQLVQKVLRECATCQQAKTERCPPAGLLQPLDVPGQPREVITLNFIEGLPRSANYDTDICASGQVLEVQTLHGIGRRQGIHGQHFQDPWLASSNCLTAIASSPVLYGKNCSDSPKQNCV
jgi:hypothetical protein